ncbi:MAG: hypothetical protein MUO67_19720 [Anaerolineales bacterium]|jgi:hypothetical protein|nr:hypothetical protein [Anaerolineales bacterium]
MFAHIGVETWDDCLEQIALRTKGWLDRLRSGKKNTQNQGLQRSGFMFSKPRIYQGGVSKKWIYSKTPPRVDLLPKQAATARQYPL